MKSVAAPGQFPPDTGWEVAMAGRSNSGKSSVINALLDRKGMARTSRTPGRTRLYNYFELTPGKRLVDLPGYGHASVNVRNPGELGAAGRGPAGAPKFRGHGAGGGHPARGGGHGPGHAGMGGTARPERTHVLLNKSDKLARGEAQDGFAACARRRLQGRAAASCFRPCAARGSKRRGNCCCAGLREAERKEITPAE